MINIIKEFSTFDSNELNTVTTAVYLSNNINNNTKANSYSFIIIKSNILVEPLIPVTFDNQNENKSFFISTLISPPLTGVNHSFGPENRCICSFLQT